MAKRKQYSSDLLIVLLLFFVYAICALLLCVVGVNAYSQTVSVLQEGYNQRSGILYIAQKVHHNDIGGGVRVDQYDDTDALVLVEQDTGTGYETWIFIKDGYLCELVVAAGSDVTHEQAQRIMPMQDMALELGEANLLRLEVTTDTGTVHSMSLAIRSSGNSYNATGDTLPRSSDTGTSDIDGGTVMTPAPGEGGTS